MLVVIMVDIGKHIVDVKFIVERLHKLVFVFCKSMIRSESIVGLWAENGLKWNMVN